MTIRNLRSMVPDRERMLLDLVELNRNEVIGIYGPEKRTLPKRMRYLHPDAASSYAENLHPHVRVSDMYRSADSQLNARQTRRGSQKVGYSGHGYGFSIDLDVTRTMRALGMTQKAALDGWMEQRGWYCHRLDGMRVREDWHYNYFGSEFSDFYKPHETRTSHALERKIQQYYGGDFELDSREIQIALAEIGLYKAAIDGIIGDISRTAITAFQRTWLLQADGIAGPITQRTLAFVTADTIS